MTDQDVETAIRELALERGASKTFCPSEVARRLAADWRPLMDHVRRVAASLPDVRATQRGVEVDPRVAKGPVRLGLHD
ncbi:MAG: DUF3253 domain-containing protein [Pseudomonadota bacterium]